MPQRIDTEGIRKILVTRLIIDKEVSEFDLNKEMVSLLRRELRRDAVRGPRRGAAAAARAAASGSAGQQRLLAGIAEAHGADLVIAGKAGFVVSDRSGFVQMDEISPLTGSGCAAPASSTAKGSVST